jgi:hypothetical protein
MYEMRIGSFVRGVYDVIFLWVVKRHWKKEGMLVKNQATAPP